jgi:hypothetical protein
LRQYKLILTVIVRHVEQLEQEMRKLRGGDSTNKNPTTGTVNSTEVAMELEEDQMSFNKKSA